MFEAGSKFGTFEIEECLGSGAMGVVYKAFDSQNRRPVALKLIDEKLADSEEYRNRLAVEAEAAGKIDSENVVKVYESAEVNGQPFIALEYVSGKDLRTACEDYDFNQKLDIFRQVATGLKAAHEIGVVHRDLKPENIKLDENNIVKILDFGLAKTVSADSVDRHGNIEGTLYYLSPEQITGEPPTYSSDIFSLGIIMYELFAGERPFEGDYSAAIIYSILHEDPKPPCEISNDLPGWVDVLCLKLLSKQPSERFGSITEMLDYLDRCQVDRDKVSTTVVRTRQTVTVIDLKNLSGDESWEYFCVGFTDDLINELSRRTNLIISAEPSSIYSRNVREVFRRCRSDFVIVGSLIKWQENIRLNLTVYGNHGANLISGKNYESNSKDIFKTLSQAVEDTSICLEESTGLRTIDVDDYFNTDIAAYEYYLKGKNYYQTNKPEELQLAERMFEKALEIDSELAYAYSGLSDVYAFQFMAYYDRSQERIDLARRKAEKAIEIAPELPEAHRSLGRYFMFTGKYDKAENAFHKAIELNPKYAIGYRTLAWLREIQGDHSGALEWAKKSLAYAPNDLETLLLLSLVNMDLRKFTVAMATLQRAIELAPDYGRAFYNLAVVYMKLGVVDLALENFELAVKYKGDPNAYTDGAYAYIVNGEYDKAKKLLDMSIEEECFPFIAKYLLGVAEKMKGNEEQALALFKESVSRGWNCVEQDKDNLHLKAYLAISLAAAGEGDKSLVLLEDLKTEAAEDGEILLNIARSFAILGDTDKANKYINLAVEAHTGPTKKQIYLDFHFQNTPIDI